MHQAYNLKNKSGILNIFLLSEQTGMGYFGTSAFENNNSYFLLWAYGTSDTLHKWAHLGLPPEHGSVIITFILRIRHPRWTEFQGFSWGSIVNINSGLANITISINTMTFSWAFSSNSHRI